MNGIIIVGLQQIIRQDVHFAVRLSSTTWRRALCKESISMETAQAVLKLQSI